MNSLLRLLELYPDAKWNYEDLCENINIPLSFLVANLHRPKVANCISRNPNVTLAFVKANPNIPWKWDELSRYMHMTWQDYVNNPYYPWHASWVIANVSATWEMIHSVKHNSPLNWGIISRSRGIKWEDFKNNPDLEWNMYRLARHPNFPVENMWKYGVITEDIGEFLYGDYTAEEAYYRAINEESEDESDDDIEYFENQDVYNIPGCDYDAEEDAIVNTNNHPRYKKRMFYLQHIAGNPNLYSQFLEDKCYSAWGWKYMGGHPNFSIDEVLYWTKKSRISHIAWNPNITIERAVELGKRYIDFYFLAQNDAIEVKDLEKYPDFEIHHQMLSMNATLNWKYVRDNIDKPWCFANLSRNRFNYSEYFGSKPHMLKMRKHFMENFAEAIAKKKID
jgi:hypothetical protein